MRRNHTIGGIVIVVLVCCAATGQSVAAPTLAKQIETARTEGYWDVQEGQWLSRIAGALAPGDAELRRALEKEIFNSNPDAFFRDSPDYLSTGKRLKVTFPFAAVGRAQAVLGRVEAENRHQRKRALISGGAVYVGDHITTGTDGSIELELSDGARFKVRPRSELSITDYRYDPKRPERWRSLIELRRGGVNVRSGAIGKQQPDRYRLQTPVVNIGVRGTEYGAFACSPDDCLLNDYAQSNVYGRGAYVGVKAGALSIANQAGEKAVAKNEYFHVESRVAAPRQIPPPRGFFAAPAIVRSACIGQARDGSPGTLGPCPDDNWSTGGIPPPPDAGAP